MKIVPFEVLRKASRERYQEKVGSTPEPRVINARPLATLDAPRSFVWGGIGYWCPPLSYEGGSRLLIAANALRDLRKSGNAVRLDAARITAARIVRKHIRSRRPLWRLTRAFYREPDYVLEGLIRELLYVEDESTIVPSDRPVTVDLIDNLYTFEGYFKRRPRSWADYVYGMRHIGRAASRTDFRSAVSIRVGTNADKKGWQDFEREIRQMAGWSN